jgi:hypothetical protein
LFKSRCRAGGGWLNVPIDMNDLFKPAYDAGARVHSNSWGCKTTDSAGQNCNNYESQAQAIDK